ncbi:ubiquitin carboxyl-terminal hydrolase 21 isoform X2 [Amia ocellicauda]|uniref:ubiquitin carboxyl-terminal hydrolase 21 isoform X2 n=1 Tax=Amia ocellicauda TaxID=2972642 RepID=UPI0034640A0E
MPGAAATTMEDSCQALCRSLVTHNTLQQEGTDISQSVLYTSLMGLLLVTEKEKQASVTLGSGQLGICNVGNTCFLNAVLQCLSHTLPLRDYCLSEKYRQEMSSQKDPELMDAFSRVLSDLWAEEGASPVHPGRFFSLFKESVPCFNGYSQQDAQEFLRFLLDRLHSEINRRSPRNPPSADLPESKRQQLRTSGPKIDALLIYSSCLSLRVEERASLMWNRYLEKDDSKIVDLFAGQLRSSLCCSTCGHQSTTFDVFCDLSLPIPKRSVSGGIVALKDCLDLFSQEEDLDSENTPMCDRCGKRTEGTKKLTIQRFPRIIVLHLNRFATSRVSICKSTVSVSFPLRQLDLSCYGAEGTGQVLYNLYAVCNHSGTVNMGHYTAHCREDMGWYCYNDSRVSPVTESQLQSNQAYLLFYEMDSCDLRKAQKPLPAQTSL